VKYGANEEMNHVGVYLPPDSLANNFKMQNLPREALSAQEGKLFHRDTSRREKQKGKGDKGKEPVNDMKNRVYGRL